MNISKEKNEIKKLEKDFEDILEIHQDVNKLVEFNGNKINIIEDQVENTSLIVKNGNKDLKKTLILSRKYLPLKVGFISGIVGCTVLGPVGIAIGLPIVGSMGISVGGGILLGTIGGIMARK